ncbi:radical SAM protein [Candidatus Woesebacteria bacterium]|nr:radical SAM protein [Candidatus Woesebacteria bacterium]
MRYFVKTFGCQQNVADSERIVQAFEGRGMQPAQSYEDANYVIINTCMVRESAENRVYGLVNKLRTLKQKKQKRKELFKIIVTGCMVGVAFRDSSGKYLAKLRRVMPAVDEFMPIEEVGFDSEPVRTSNTHALVPISNGCNNFCTFCIVPFTRGREISRPYEDIIDECVHLKARGYKSVMLLGQNVNSYGADLIMGKDNVQVMRDLEKTVTAGSEAAKQQRHDGADTHEDENDTITYFTTDTSLPSNHTKNNKDRMSLLSTIRAQFTYNGREVAPVYVKHLGRHRIPTLFPYLLEDIARMDFALVDFISSNPWDFSDELIETIAAYPNITRTIHLPVQSGDDHVLKRMNRWYTAKEYLTIIEKVKKRIPGVKFTTDIIVGFCGEADDEFENTVKLVKKVGFEKAYISIYSQRPMTAATKVMADDVPHPVKKKRWKELENLINR